MDKLVMEMGLGCVDHAGKKRYYCDLDVSAFDNAREVFDFAQKFLDWFRSRETLCAVYEDSLKVMSARAFPCDEADSFILRIRFADFEEKGDALEKSEALSFCTIFRKEIEPFLKSFDLGNRKEFLESLSGNV